MNGEGALLEFSSLGGVRNKMLENPLESNS